MLSISREIIMVKFTLELLAQTNRNKLQNIVAFPYYFVQHEEYKSFD